METIQKDYKKIDWGKAFLRVLELLVIKPFTLPFKIYMNSLRNLSNDKLENGESPQLPDEFPLYVWLISIFDALIFLIYPIGVIVAIKSANSYFGGFGVFMGVLSITYFCPLYMSLIREFAQISLKVLLYLKIMASKK